MQGGILFENTVSKGLELKLESETFAESVSKKKKIAESSREEKNQKHGNVRAFFLSATPLFIFTLSSVS
jgi:hypothetical protein